MCEEIISEEKIVMSSKFKFNKEREVNVNLNAQIREALTTEESFNDEFFYDDAIFKVMCLNVELRN